MRILFQFLERPLILLIDAIISITVRLTGNIGASILVPAFVGNILILPLYLSLFCSRKEFSSCTPDQRTVATIEKNSFLRKADLQLTVFILLEIPIIVATWHYFSSLQILNGTPFLIINDLGKPDSVLGRISSTVHILPLIATGIRLLTCILLIREVSGCNRVLIVGKTVFLLVLMYNAPAGMSVFWILNSMISLLVHISCRSNRRRTIFAYLSGLFGIAICIAMVISHPDSKRELLLFFSAAFFLILISFFLFQQKRGTGFQIPIASTKEHVLFICSCACLTLLTGGLIPSSVIQASPAEFIEVLDLHSPIRYVLMALITAFGLFMFWFCLYYYLADSRIRKVLSFLAAIAVMMALVNYLFFGNRYGNMSSLLQYDETIQVSVREIAVNLVTLFLCTTCLVFLLVRHSFLVRAGIYVVTIELMVLSIINMVKIQTETANVIDTVSLSDHRQTPRFTLDQSGRNVVVIMMDRAINCFFPYLLEERPELKRQFDGFCYYPNTISYSSCTRAGAPGIFGGYEYIPEAMNQRTDKTIYEKNNEALKVMPVSFLKAGYSVTVMDPSNAGYGEVTDLSIYDDYPEINAFLATEYYGSKTPEIIDRENEIRFRNLFCYSIVRIAPVMFQPMLYIHGYYNEADAQSTLLFEKTGIQIINSISESYGLSTEFLRSYAVLENLCNMTEMRNSGKGSFLMMTNETTHDPMLLSEPSYGPARQVDNREYDEQHPIRYNIYGESMQITTEQQMIHYHANMAAMIQLGKWFDYLREKEVYNNTRIIIVADHGRDLGLFNLQIGVHRYEDIMYYHPLLLVKDFDQTGIETDRSFMTNADVPVIALKDLINTPINPMTGKKLESGQKNFPEQKIAFAVDIIPGANDKSFDNVIWIKNQNSVFEMDKWSVMGKD